MLKKSEGPSEAKLFFDTRAVPLAANLAGSLEVALERASVRSGIRPSLILAACLGAGPRRPARTCRSPHRSAADG